MKNIVIIGQSPAAYTAVKALLDRDPSLGVTLISCDGQVPYDRMLLPGLIDRSVKEKDIFTAPQDFYQAAQVQVVLDQEITRINFNRKRIFCVQRPGQDPKAPAGKLNVDFDGLIMADVPEIRFPQVKGVRRQGVFHLARFEMVKSLIRYLPFTETVVVEPLGFAGIRAALALKAIGKEVIIASRHELLLSDILPLDRAGVLMHALEKRGVRVIPAQGGVEDIIGEAEVKAVRLRSGKVVACDMVVIEDVVPDLRFMADTDLVLAQRIPVSKAMAANVAQIYAVDAVSQMDDLKFIGGYWMNTDIGSFQAVAAVAGLLSEERDLTTDDLTVRDILEVFFHPQELAPAIQEVTV